MKSRSERGLNKNSLLLSDRSRLKSTREKVANLHDKDTEIELSPERVKIFSNRIPATFCLQIKRLTNRLHAS